MCISSSVSSAAKNWSSSAEVSLDPEALLGCCVDVEDELYACLKRVPRLTSELLLLEATGADDEDEGPGAGEGSGTASDDEDMAHIGVTRYRSPFEWNGFSTKVCCNA